MTTRRRTRVIDLCESRVREDAPAADVELSPGDLLPGLRDHRVALESTGAALPGEVDGGARERAADSATPETRAGDEAGHGPDAVVGLVLRSPIPGDAAVAQQPRVGVARLDRAPSDGLAVEVGDETTRRVRLRVAAVGLRAKSVRAFLGGERGPRLLRLHLVPLAVAPGRIATRAEDGLEILPGHFVRGHDGDRGIRRHRDVLLLESASDDRHCPTAPGSACGNRCGCPLGLGCRCSLSKALES